MDFWDLMRMLVRRWMISIPALIVSLGLAFLAISSARPDYISTSYLQLVPPITQSAKSGQTIAQRNPWLDQDLSALGDAAVVILQDQTVMDQMLAAGLSDSYTLQVGAVGAMTESYQTGRVEPMVTLEVVAKSREQADATAKELTTRFTASISDLQTAYGVTDTDMITPHRLDLGSNIRESNANVKRAGGALLAVALMATIAITAAVDAWLRRRPTRSIVSADRIAVASGS